MVLKASEICRRRIFGTTADLGISVSAPTPESLFACAGDTLFSGLTDRRSVRSLLSREVRLSAENPEYLMVAWLNELIYIFDTEGFLARKCRVRLSGGKRLSAVLRGEKYDPTRHKLWVIFKAATYHRLRVASDGRRWRAVVFMDV